LLFTFFDLLLVTQRVRKKKFLLIEKSQIFLVEYNFSVIQLGIIIK
jgi:hypothetical protein